MLSIDIFNKTKSIKKIISKNSKNQINYAVLNSNNANKNNIFVAIKGFKTDGHKYILDAYQNGCRDFIVENIGDINNSFFENSTIIQVSDSREMLSIISNIINDYPHEKMKMIGITGTKGKTTVTTLIHHLLTSKYKSSMFSTVKNISAGIKKDAIRTTMEANELQELLNKSYQSNETHAVVEVSSHAVTLKRVFGIQWDIGVFTSFSRDHLDLYLTMDKYFDAKLDFFRSLNASNKKNKLAIINMDDPKGNDVCSILDNSVKTIKIGKNSNFDYFIEEFSLIDDGMIIKLRYKNQIINLKTRMKGIFNVSNIVLAVAVCMESGINIDIILKRLLKFNGVEGRFEIIIDKPFTVIVDYAHTPDSLQKILEEARKLSNNRVICVFGCTGERDKDKRNIMGNIAANHSDYSIITNDDTYQEDPNFIVSQVEIGFIESNKNINEHYKIILDRKKAIKEVISNAKKGDVIVLAGMGHEKVQYLNNGPIKHNDKDTALKIFKKYLK